MQIDPIAEWRRLTEHYRQMSDAQLDELARDFVDLTETAQQILRGELRQRGLDLPGSADKKAQASNQAQTLPSAVFAAPETAAVPFAGSADGQQEDDRPHEYTWKTFLCECEESEQVWQLQEMLRRAGIDSWSEDQGAIGDGGLRYPRILVAADQLDEARAVIARPVPQDVIDESRMPVADYQPPRCPSCRTADPILESADPVNCWRCASCGRQWSDPAPAAGAEP